MFSAHRNERNAGTHREQYAWCERGQRDRLRLLGESRVTQSNTGKGFEKGIGELSLGAMAQDLLPKATPPHTITLGDRGST